MSRRIRNFAYVSILVAGALAAAGWTVDVGAQVPKSLVLPEATDAGRWDGTWYYVNRDYRIAMWIRTERGKPRIKLQLMSLGAPEGFVTDWKGHADYLARNHPGTFDLAIEQADATSMRGTWFWDLQFPRSGRKETAKVRLYRAGHGRSIVLVFEDLERVIRRRDQENTYRAPRAWTFIQASKRQVLWDELPF